MLYWDEDVFVPQCKYNILSGYTDVLSILMKHVSVNYFVTCGMFFDRR